jgi:hypothetical protein
VARHVEVHHIHPCITEVKNEWRHSYFFHIISKRHILKKKTTHIYIYIFMNVLKHANCQL